MRKIIVMLLVLCFFTSNAFSQKKTISFNNITIKEVLQKLEDVYPNVNFSYNTNLESLTKKVSKKYDGKTLDYILTDILKPEGLQFKKNGNSIIIYSPSARKKKYTISGYVYDEANGEAMVGVNIYVANTFKGVITNTYGFYSLTLAEGKTQITTSHLGYTNNTIAVNVVSDVRKDIFLAPSNFKLDEVVIRSKVKNNKNINKKFAGAVNISSKDIKLMPLPFGEPDVIKAVQLQNGVKTLSDGASFYYVRGGNHDQNLVIVDEATLYNPSHVLGLVSVINNEVIKNADFYKGYIPAKYSGRVSSVLDITTKEGNLNKFRLSGGISTLGARAVIEGPLIKDELSYMLSARKSWTNFLIKNAPEYYDINSKLHWKTNENNKLYLSFYYGKDNIKDEDNTGAKWSNTLASLRWNHIFNGKLFSNTSLIYNKFNGNNIINQQGREWINSIEELKLKEALTYYVNDKNKITTTAQIGLHNFIPGKFKDNSINLGNKKNVSYSFSATHNAKINSKLTLDYGFNLKLYNALGKTNLVELDDNYNVLNTFESKSGSYKSWTSIEPRANVMYKFNDNHRAFVSYSTMQQFAHSLDNYENDYEITKIWVPVSNNIKPIKSNIYSVGYNFNKSIFSLNTELFYKKINNQLDYTPYPDLYSVSFEKSLRSGKATAYGAEIGVGFKTDKLNVQVDYSYSKAELQIPDINNGTKYVAAYDIPHQLSINTLYKFNTRYHLSALWKFSSGRPFTLPIGTQLVNNGGTFEDSPLFGQKNNARGINYHRLDLMLSVLPKKNKTRWEGTWKFGVSNAYGRQNPISYSYDYKGGKANTFSTSLTGFLPTIAYSFEF